MQRKVNLLLTSRPALNLSHPFNFILSPSKVRNLLNALLPFSEKRRKRYTRKEFKQNMIHICYFAYNTRKYIIFISLIQFNPFLSPQHIIFWKSGS